MGYLMLTLLRGIGVVVIWITADLIVPPVLPRQSAAGKVSGNVPDNEQAVYCPHKRMALHPTKNERTYRR